MPARSKGGRRVPLGGVPRSGDCGEASEPIGDHTEQLSLQIQELLKLRDQLKNCDEDTAAAKKRRTELEPDISFEEDVFMQKIENAMANACRGFIMPGGTSSTAGDMQSLRTEMKEDITRVQTQLTEVFNSAIEQMQVEADRRTAAVFERLVQQVQEASRQTDKGETNRMRSACCNVRGSSGNSAQRDEGRYRQSAVSACRCAECCDSKDADGIRQEDRRNATAPGRKDF